MKTYRHGDVNLHEISEEKWNEIKQKGKRLDKNGSYILARGEATGSVHEIKSPTLEVYEYEGKTYLRVLEVVPVTHTVDHETIMIEPKPYRQVQEREVDHFENSLVRRVVD